MKRPRDMLEREETREAVPRGRSALHGLRLWTLLALAGAAVAQGGAPIGEDFQLAPTDGETGDYFGTSMAAGMGTLVIGAYGDDSPTGTDDSGSAYVFRRSGSRWVQETILRPADPQSDMWFGFAASASVDTAVVGAPEADAVGAASGAAYVYRRDGSTWTQVSKLVASDTISSDRFGYSVCVDADRIVVGTHYADPSGADSGAAYVFVRNGGSWVEEAKLVASDASAQGFFGDSVAIWGETIVVGAPGASGAAYVFWFDGARWTEQAKLAGSGTQVGDVFGDSVSLHADTIVVGASRAGAADNGEAYVFTREGDDWVERARLPESPAPPGSGFGYSVAVLGDQLAVGAPWDDTQAPGAGGAYLFLRCGLDWTPDGMRLHQDADSNDAFGWSVALAEGLLASGATGANPFVGAAYVHVHASVFSTALCSGDGSGSACPCGNSSDAGLDEGCRNSTGSGAAIRPGGSARAREDDLRVHACQLMPNQPALLFAGLNSIAGGDGLPFGDGLRCVGGGIVRLGIGLVDPDGDRSWGPGLGVAGGWSAGDVRYLQVWYRNPTDGPCGSNFNLSGALEVRFQP